MLSGGRAASQDENADVPGGVIDRVRILSCVALVPAVVVLAGCRSGESGEAGRVTVAPVATSADAAPERPSITSASCPVTVPKSKPSSTAGIGADDFNYGSARLRAKLYWPHGTITAGVRPDGSAMATINPDGSITAKVGWWRGLDGTLAIEGSRLDGSAPPLIADIPEGYGSHGFQPTGLTFPTVGCWRVVGKVGTSSLTFVVRVTKLRARR